MYEADDCRCLRGAGGWLFAEPEPQSARSGSSSTPRMVKVGWDPPEVPAQRYQVFVDDRWVQETFGAVGGCRVQMPGRVGAGSAGPARCEGRRVRFSGPGECPSDADRAVMSGSRFAFEVRTRARSVCRH